jgi:phage terminase large subunit-like protein
VLPTGIFGRLYDGTARYLANRIVSGPHPAILDLKTENRNGRDIIIQGEATWAGQSLEVCQAQIDEWGLPAFLAECQHDVYSRSGQIFLPEWFSIEDGRNRFSINDKGLFNRCIGRFQFWDTALKDKKHNDPSMCITVDLTPNYTLLLRDVWTDRIESAYLPEVIKEQAARWNDDMKLQEIVIEDKGSGTTSIQTIRKSAPEWLVSMIREFTPHGSKDYRAKTASMWMPRNCFSLPYPDASLVWYVDLLDDLKGQFFRFAGEGTVPHDEFIDCVSMCVLYLEHYLSQGYYARLANQTVLDERPSIGIHSRIQQALLEESLQ